MLYFKYKYKGGEMSVINDVYHIGYGLISINPNSAVKADNFNEIIEEIQKAKEGILISKVEPISPCPNVDKSKEEGKGNNIDLYV